MEGLTVQTWEKDGVDRLYVNDAAGRTLGYLDRSSGLLHLADPRNVELRWAVVGALWEWSRPELAALAEIKGLRLFKPWPSLVPGGSAAGSLERGDLVGLWFKAWGVDGAAR